MIERRFYIGNQPDIFNHLIADRSYYKVRFCVIGKRDEINRQGGFVAAQRTLENFLSEIKRHLSLNDTCYRYGMNKILLFLMDKNKEQSQFFCEGLAGKMQKKRIIDIDPYPGFCFKVSMGFAIADKSALLDDLLIKATSDSSRFCDIQVC